MMGMKNTVVPACPHALVMRKGGREGRERVHKIYVSYENLVDIFIFLVTVIIGRHVDHASTVHAVCIPSSTYC